MSRYVYILIWINEKNYICLFALADKLIQFGAVDALQNV